MGYPKDICHQHFIVVSGTDGNSKDRYQQRLRCKYCNVYEVCRHAVRMRNHLMECPDAPRDVKDTIEEYDGKGINFEPLRYSEPLFISSH